MAIDALIARAAAIGSDRTASASELLRQLLPLLDDAIPAGQSSVIAVARVVCAAQPAMSSLWNGCAAALAEFESPGRFARVRAEMERAPDALVRSALPVLGAGIRRVATISYSSNVVAVLCALARARALLAVCAESVPGGEGRRTATTLATAGADIELVDDALLSTYLRDVDAVIVGADAISPRDWINKAGTFGIAAAAFFTGTPVYVCATRDKAQSEAMRGRIELPRVFERIPVELATLILTDAGPITPADLPQFLGRFDADLDRLFRAF